MARAKKTYPEEAKLAAQMKALREKTGGDYTDAQEKQMSGWRSELNDLQFRRLATARVNKIGRMLLLLGNLTTIIASRTHDAVNSRMDALLKEIRKAAIAEGKAPEQKAQKERDSN
jgi:hypothetical protein